MKTEFLKGLGLEQEAIDAIMAENGKDVNRYKTEADALKGQLATANATIEQFKGVDVDKIKQQAEEYKAKYEQSVQENKEKIEKMTFDHLLDGVLRGQKVKSTKAAMALLDMNGLKLNGDTIVGLDEQITKLKTDHGYLFEAEEKPPMFTGSTPGFSGATGADDKRAKANAALRAALGKE